MKEINGFQIEKYNIHSIPEGAKYWTCPECSHTRKKSKEKCMSVFWDTGLGRCNHCGAQVQLHTYKKKGADKAKNYRLPKPLPVDSAIDDKVVEWFESREISKNTLLRLRVTNRVTGMRQSDGTYKDMNAIMFPYYRDDELVNIKYRDGRKNFKLETGAEHIPYNLDGIRTSKECVIVEGELDMMSYAEIGRWDTVSLPNGATKKGVNLGWLDRTIEYFENKDTIYIGLDDDEAGLNTQKEIIRRLGADKCKVIDLQGYLDPNELLMEAGKDALIESIENAKEMPIEHVSSVGDWEDEYDHFLVSGMDKGYGIGIPSFDKNFTTYLGQFITLTGKPGDAKSDFGDQMAIGYNKTHGWKVAFASPENKPNVIHASKLEAKLTGQWVKTKEQINTEWHRKAKDFIHDNFKFIDLEKYTLEAVLSKTKEMIRRFGIKVLVIDPYNKIPLENGGDPMKTAYTSEYLLKLDEFARNNDILIILVAHPRKPGIGETKGYIPTMYDIKGGGEFYDMSPHGLVAYRDRENDAFMIEVLKCKFYHLGESGTRTWFRWNKNNGRFSEFEITDSEIENCHNPMHDNSNPFDSNSGTPPLPDFSAEGVFETGDLPF